MNFRYYKLVIFFFLLVPSAQADGDVAQDNLLRAWGQYQSVTSIYCKATEIYSSASLKLKESPGTFEYWADEDKFRVSDTIPAAPLISDEVFYIPNQIIQWHIISSDTLAISKRTSVINLPYETETQTIPLLPLRFLASDSQAGMHLWLHDLKTPKVKSVLEQAHLVKGLANEAEIPCDPYYSKPSHYRITFGSDPPFMPTRIRRLLNANDENVCETVLTYKPYVLGATTLYFPSSVKIFINDPKDDATRAYEVSSIKVNEPIPADTFVFDYHKVGKVFNMDTNQEIKVNPGELPPDLTDKTTRSGGSVTITTPPNRISDEVSGNNWGKRLKAWAIVGGLCGAVIVAVVILLRRKSGPTSH